MRRTISVLKENIPAKYLDSVDGADLAFALAAMKAEE